MINQNVIAATQEHLTSIGKKLLIEEIPQWLDENYSNNREEISHRLFVNFNDNDSNYVGEIQKIYDGFQTRLIDIWGKPILRLQSLHLLTQELLTEINFEFRASATKSSKYNVITRLHARALQVLAEIIQLCKGGFAEGAMARWRTLYETTVTMKLLSICDESVSEKFIDYQHVLHFKECETYRLHSDTHNFHPMDDEISNLLKQNYESVIEKYSSNFSKQNAWAEGVVQLKKGEAITFRTLEKEVNLEHFRIQYNFANQYIHSGVDSIGFKLGLSKSKKDLLLTGPSNEGLIEPIQLAAFSIISATEALIHVFRTPERLIYESVLWKWFDILKEELHEASQKLIESGNRNG
ncbi:MAG: hypothetical protein JWQ21_4144 [Herminiimonas sp.]|nr:hypothetical protein [Herminiimonas sp.]